MAKHILIPRSRRSMLTATALVHRAGIGVAARRAGSGARPPPAVPFDGEIADFYRARGGAPLWFAPSSGSAADQLIQLLASAQADHLNPRRYDVRGLRARGGRRAQRQSGSGPARRGAC